MGISRNILKWSTIRQNMGSRNKILIIDDDENTLVYLSMFFAENDFYVISAKNGREGIQKALTEKPGIIILGMPEESDVMVIRKLQVNKNTKNIPVIIIKGVIPYFKRFLKLNGQFQVLKDYIKKPIDRDLLLKKVKELLKP